MDMDIKHEFAYPFWIEKFYPNTIGYDVRDLIEQIIQLATLTPVTLILYWEVASKVHNT